MQRPEDYDQENNDDYSGDEESQQKQDQTLESYDIDGEVNWLAMARDSFETSTDYFDANIRKQLEKNISLFRSKHPAGSKYYQESYKYRSKVFRPKVRSIIRRHEAAAALAFFSTIDTVSCDPEDPNDENSILGAKFGKNWVDFRLEHSIQWFKTIIGAYNEAMVNGIVISRQEWVYEEEEFEEDEVVVENGLVVLDEDGEPQTESKTNHRIKIDKPDIVLVPVENFRFSTASDWRDPVGTSPFLIEMIPMFVQDVIERTETTNSKTGETKWKNVNPEHLLSARQTGDYDTTRMAREGKRMDSKDQSHQIKLFDIVWVHRNIIRHSGVDYLYYTLGTEHLLSDPVPLEDVFLHGRPYVVGSIVIEPHRNYSTGVPELSQDLVVEANDVTNQRLDNIKLILNKRYRARRGTNVDWRALTTSVPGGVILMDSLDDVEPEEFHDVTSSAYQEQDRINVDIDELLGSFSMGSVQTNRHLNETVGGMDIASDDSNAVTEFQLRVFTETWVEGVLRQLITMGQKYETDQRILKIVGEGADPGTVAALMDTEYAIKVAVGYGATAPHKRIEKLSIGLKTVGEFMPEKLSQINGDEVMREVFGALGYRDGSRFFTTQDEEDPQVAELKKQVEQLTQQIESGAAEKQAEGQVKLEAVQMKEQGDTQRMQMKLDAEKQVAQLDMQIKYIKEQVAAEKNDIARGELILQQETLEFQKREKELTLLTDSNDRISSVLMRDQYGMVPAAEEMGQG